MEKLLKDCSVLDVVNQRVAGNRSILVEGSRVKKIGPVEELAPFEKSLKAPSVFELGNRLVLPGLIDAHVHLNVIPAANELETTVFNLRASENLKVLWGAKNAAETLHSGFTTVRDVGQGDNLALRDAIERDVIQGPRIVACGWLGMSSGHQQHMAPESAFNVKPRPADVGTDGVWSVRRQVRKLIGKGVDCIKTYSTGEGFLPHPFHPLWCERTNYTLEELVAIVNESHAAGRRVAAHAMVNEQGIKNAISAGVDTLEHGIFLDEVDAENMSGKGIYYVPTLAVMRKMWDVDDSAEIHYLKIKKEDANRYLDAHMTSLQRAREHGVKIAAGTDTFRILKHGDNVCEMIALVDSGMSEMEALVSATIVSAEALGIESMVGSIEEGKLADLLVVDPNPLNDISVLLDKKNLKLIMKNGDVVCSRM
jgi:imidazolonepropionase-like amidohydrolase